VSYQRTTGLNALNERRNVLQDLKKKKKLACVTPEISTKASKYSNIRNSICCRHYLYAFAAHRIREFHECRDIFSVENGVQCTEV
jgi:hypothetical protein